MRSIVLGQSGKLVVVIEKHGILPRLYEFVTKLEQLHWPTLGLTVLSFAVLLLGPRHLRRLPAALLAMVLCGAVTALFDLEALGVATVGEVPAGLHRRCMFPVYRCT